MTQAHNPILRTLLLTASILLVAMFVAQTVSAQEEPTPVPEPPASASEPAAATEPVQSAAPAPTTAPSAPAEPEQAKVPMVYRDKTRITINGRAEMEGVIELGVKPDGEDPIKVRVNVLKKTKKKKITKALAEQLVFAIGDRYKVKQTNDQTIRVEAKKKNPPVAIWLLTQNLSGVSIMVGHG